MSNDPVATDRYKQYVKDVLAAHEALAPILSLSTIVLNDYENGYVWDYLILPPEELYEEQILRKYGPNLVIDDHEHSPWVFTKVRSFEWVKQDIVKRAAIALWIYLHAEVMQDPERRFPSLVQSYQQEYAKKIPTILRQKYLELRSERHNLRYTAFHEQDVASQLIKSCLVKLALELCYVFEAKPYPFKALLARKAAEETENGEKVLFHSKQLLESQNPHEVIRITDDLIREIDRFLITSPYVTEDFLRSWWLYLS